MTYGLKATMLSWSPSPGTVLTAVVVGSAALKPVSHQPPFMKWREPCSLLLRRSPRAYARPTPREERVVPRDCNCGVLDRFGVASLCGTRLHDADHTGALPDFHEDNLDWPAASPSHWTSAPTVTPSLRKKNL